MPDDELRKPTSQLDWLENKDKYGRTFTYWHATGDQNLTTLLQDGLSPGGDGYIYVSVREDFAAQYGNVMLKIRLPYELEANPFSPTINGERRLAGKIPPEYISVMMPMQLFQTVLAKREAKARIDERFGVASHIKLILMPVLVHCLEPSFPSMTREIIYETDTITTNYMNEWLVQNGKHLLKSPDPPNKEKEV